MTPACSDHFNGKTFFQPHHGYAGRIRDLLRWKHWGTFQLTDEGRDEPVAALASALNVNGVSREAFRVVAPGDSVTI